MTDRISKKTRSLLMAKIKGSNTKPEIIVRKLLFRLGFRFRLHKASMPGKPDIVLPKYKTVIFVHGCFWHGHKNCKRSSLPDQNGDFWMKKINANVKRDNKTRREIKRMGWKPIVVWECSLRNTDQVARRLLSCMRKSV